MTGAPNCDFGSVTRHRILDRKGRITGYVAAYDDGRWRLDGDPFASDLLRTLTELKLDLGNQEHES